MKLLITLLLVVIFFSNAVNTASAHGLGTSMNQVVGNYFIAFEYDALGNVQAGEFISYDMDLLDANTKEFLDYNRLFLRLTQKGHNTPFLTGNIAPVDILGKKAARINMTIPDAGEYTAKFDFYDAKNEKITEASFEFAVDPPYQKEGKKSNKGVWPFVSVGTFVIGFLGGIAIRKSKKKEEKENA